MSSAYVVLDEVWHLLGKHPTEERCSWLSIPALKRREIGEIVRTQSGTYPKFPCELDVIGGMKKLPGVKDAQITLLDFAQTEVVKFMRSNARTVRLSGTVFSRTVEMQQDLATFIEENPHATEIPLDWVLEFVDKLEGAVRVRSPRASIRRPSCAWPYRTAWRRRSRWITSQPPILSKPRRRILPPRSP